MSTFYFSCGHQDTHRPTSGWPLRLKSDDCDAVCGMIKSVIHLTVCHSCYVDWITNYPEDVIFFDYEENEYLSEETQNQET